MAYMTSCDFNDLKVLRIYGKQSFFRKELAC